MEDHGNLFEDMWRGKVTPDLLDYTICLQRRRVVRIRRRRHSEADCNTHACPVDCVGEWKTTGTCSKTCGGGQVTQTYSITQFASNGGESCAFADGATQKQIANMHACEPSVTKPILPDDDNSGQCKSYCKQDTDCSNGLVCFHRDFAEKVPGCEGPFQLFRGYCVTPAQIKGNIHNVGVNPIKILKECEGDCENDAMCEGG